MFPDTLLRYDVFTIREPLCNAIAHQDYSLSARIEVVEYEDERLRLRIMVHSYHCPLSLWLRMIFLNQDTVTSFWWKPCVT